MTDFISVKRNLITEKEKVDKVKVANNEKLSNISQNLNDISSLLEKTEVQLRSIENNLSERKKDEMKLQNEKKLLNSSIETLKENIQRINFNIKNEEDKLAKLGKELDLVSKDYETKRNELLTLENKIVELKAQNKKSIQEKSDTAIRMDAKIINAEKTLVELKKEEERDTRISPIIDFLLKEVRIDIPEVEILSALAYRNKAIGIEELKRSLSKTPPVIILKALRNLDSKGIIKFDERIDTIEIIANLLK